MKQISKEEDFEILREPLTPAFDHYNVVLDDAAKVLAWDMYHNGGVTEDMKDRYLDELMNITAWLSEQYEKAAADCDLILPEGFTDDLQRNIIEDAIKVTEKLIERVEILIAEHEGEDENDQEDAEVNIRC